MYQNLESATKELTKLGYEIKNPWDIVDLFEDKIAEYAGSKFAIALDSCTNAMFLCLKYLKAQGEIKIPKKTYLSVPSLIIHSGCKPVFEEIEWSGVYKLNPYPIVDGATRFRKNMYIKNTYHCLSFHRKKILPITKGGMILTDDENAKKWFKFARYNGRNERQDHKDIKDLDFLGWNMYMPPEQAAHVLKLFFDIHDFNEDSGGSHTYEDISDYTIFKNL